MRGCEEEKGLWTWQEGAWGRARRRRLGLLTAGESVRKHGPSVCLLASRLVFCTIFFKDFHRSQNNSPVNLFP